MAKQTGLFPLKGTIGGVNFYEDHNGGQIARRPPGPSGESVKHDAVFTNTRRHNSEFGRASRYGGLIRRAFAALMRHCHDSAMYHKLSTRIHDLLLMDNESEWGKRDLRRNTLKQLRHFELDANSLSSQYFELPVVTETVNGCMDITAGVSLKKKIRGAAAWQVKSIAATINFMTGEIKRDEHESDIYEFEKGNFGMSFRHYYDENASLFHGMCMVLYEYDAVTDENKLMKKPHVNAGFVRYVEGK